MSIKNDMIMMMAKRLLTPSNIEAMLGAAAIAVANYEREQEKKFVACLELNQEGTEFVLNIFEKEAGTRRLLPFRTFDKHNISQITKLLKNA